MDSQCPNCGGHAARLLEIRAAGSNVYGCLGCGAVIPAVSPGWPERSRAEGSLHDTWVMPHQVQNLESEAAKISRLRALRLAQAAKDRTRFPGMPAR